MAKLNENVKSALNFLQELYLTVNKPSVAAVNVTKSKHIETAILALKKYIESEIDCQNYIGELTKVSAELEQVKRERDAAIDDMGYIANKIAGCDEKLDRGDNVKDLNLGRCDVCKGQCNEDKPCKFEWRGVRED